MAAKRHIWTTVAVAAALAVGCWCYFFRANCEAEAHRAARAGDPMEWMRCEFHLTSDQYSTILRLHDEHSIVCAGHCAQVRGARERLESARQAGEAERIAAAQAELAKTEALCRSSTETHVRRVAAVMAPKEGERYLAMVLPRLAAHDHSGPPKLDAGK